MNEDMFELIWQKQVQNELSQVLEINEKTRKFGLVLTREEADELILSRNESLKKRGRVEFGNSILEQLIFAFCDSPYLNQENYLPQMEWLQDIFYCFKNECEEKLTDEELLELMRQQYDEVCYGDCEYLQSTVLERFAGAVRAGYSGYEATGGRNQYSEIDEEERWDKDLYLSVLQEMFWE